MRINLISGLVKQGDQALISMSTIQKFSARINFLFLLGHKVRSLMSYKFPSV